MATSMFQFRSAVFATRVSAQDAESCKMWSHQGKSGHRRNRCFRKVSVLLLSFARHPVTSCTLPFCRFRGNGGVWQQKNFGYHIGRYLSLILTWVSEYSICGTSIILISMWWCTKNDNSLLWKFIHFKGVKCCLFILASKERFWWVKLSFLFILSWITTKLLTKHGFNWKCFTKRKLFNWKMRNRIFLWG